jgi:hypothetical protein
MKREYEVVDPEQRYVAGERVPTDKPLMLTEKQAALDLRLGNIRLKNTASEPAKRKA